jgi:hypothetical protein
VSRGRAEHGLSRVGVAPIVESAGPQGPLLLRESSIVAAATRPLRRRQRSMNVFGIASAGCAARQSAAIDHPPETTMMRLARLLMRVKFFNQF